VEASATGCVTARTPREMSTLTLSASSPSIILGTNHLLPILPPQIPKIINFTFLFILRMSFARSNLVNMSLNYAPTTRNVDHTKLVALELSNSLRSRSFGCLGLQCTDTILIGPRASLRLISERQRASRKRRRNANMLGAVLSTHGTTSRLPPSGLA
jgi:hypothetical protein